MLLHVSRVHWFVCSRFHPISLPGKKGGGGWFDDQGADTEAVVAYYGNQSARGVSVSVISAYVGSKL